MRVILFLCCFYVFVITASEGQRSTLGFTYGQTSHINFVNSKATIVNFNKEIASAGAKGKLTNGQFVCYTDGIYKFQAYALTKNDTNVWLELYKNNDLVVSIWAHTLGDYADSGNAAVLDLTVGDTVYIRSRNQRTMNLSLYGTPDEIYTTFTGVFLGDSFHNQIGLTPAFSVGMDKTVNISGGNTIVYNKVITDIANIYDNRSGIVTVKSPGIYVFHLFSVSKQGAEIYQELYHNSDFVCALYNYADNEWSNAGNTAILHLKAGDSVAVRAASGYDHSILANLDEVYSTFSGAMIATENELNNKAAHVTAFTAGLSRDQTVSGGTKVIFDQIIIDLNHVYDQTTGDFSAPVAGLYEFTFHALGQIDKPIWLELYRNYHYIDSLYSHTPTHYATGGNAAVLLLDAGDVVFVKARVGTDNALYGRGDEIYCTFSGYLIRKTVANAGFILG